MHDAISAGICAMPVTKRSRSDYPAWAEQPPTWWIRARMGWRSPSSITQPPRGPWVRMSRPGTPAAKTVYHRSKGTATRRARIRSSARSMRRASHVKPILSASSKMLVGRSGNAGRREMLVFSIWKRLFSNRKHLSLRAFQCAPSPFNTTRTVRTRITKSYHSDQLRTYQRSIAMRCSKVVELRPLICHSPVRPGRAAL